MDIDESEFVLGITDVDRRLGDDGIAIGYIDTNRSRTTVDGELTCYAFPRGSSLRRGRSRHRENACGSGAAHHERMSCSHSVSFMDLYTFLQHQKAADGDLYIDVECAVLRRDALRAGLLDKHQVGGRNRITSVHAFDTGEDSRMVCHVG